MTADWRTLAACRGLPVALFFPAKGNVGADAKAVCPTCPVIVECRGEGAREQWGVWAGAGEPSRAKARKADPTPRPRRYPRRAPVAVCGTVGGYNRRRHKGEPTCGPCRRANVDAKAEYAARTKAVAW